MIFSGLTTLIVIVTFMAPPAQPDSFMGNGNNGQQQQQQFQVQQSPSGPVCAECVEKDSINVVQVLANGGGQQRAQDILGIQPSSPVLLTTTIFETFPTNFNGIQIIGKRTRISVYYADQQPQTQFFQQGQANFQQQAQQQQQSNNQGFQPQAVVSNANQVGQVSGNQGFQQQGQRIGNIQGFQTANANQQSFNANNQALQQQQGQSGNQAFQQRASSNNNQQIQQQNVNNNLQQQAPSNDVPSRMVNPNRYQSNPGQLGVYYQNTNGQPRAQQRADFVSDTSSTQQQVDDNGSFQAASSNSGNNGQGGISIISSGSAENNGRASSSAGISSTGTTSQNTGQFTSDSSMTNPANQQQNSGNTGIAVVASGSDPSSDSNGQFQGITPQPTQNFASSQVNNGLVGRVAFQSLSAYSIQGTNGYVTAGVATFEAASMGAPFTTVTDIRTVSPTFAQPNDSFLTSSTRLEALHVPISNTRILGQRTLFSYYYVLSGNSKVSSTDSSITFATLSSALLQPTPALPAPTTQAVQTDQNANQGGMSSLSSGSSAQSIGTNFLGVGSTSSLGTATNGQQTNKTGTFCTAGFFAAKDGSCLDVNECIAEVSVCGSSAKCVNDIGSFHCIDSNTGDTVAPIPVQPPVTPMVSFQPERNGFMRIFLNHTTSTTTTAAPISQAAFSSSSNQNSAQRFTAADSTSSQQSSSSRDLDAIYNPTYNSNSGGLQSSRASGARSDFGEQSASTTAVQGNNGQSIGFMSLTHPNAATSGGSVVASSSTGDSSQPQFMGSSVAFQPMGVSSGSFSQGSGVQAVGSSASSSSSQSSSQGSVQTGFRIADPGSVDSPLSSA